MSRDILNELAAVIAARRSSGDKSYTRQLLDAGPERCAKKFGEEAVETVIAALAEDDGHLAAEAADLLYHLLVLLESRNVAIADVLSLLAARMSRSGLEEKASRGETRG
jgi:phosphoribosyl-ATP pyrophosphohydrolase